MASLHMASDHIRAITAYILHILHWPYNPNGVFAPRTCNTHPPQWDVKLRELPPKFRLLLLVILPVEKEAVLIGEEHIEFSTSFLLRTRCCNMELFFFGNAFAVSGVSLEDPMTSIEFSATDVRRAARIQ